MALDSPATGTLEEQAPVVADEFLVIAQMPTQVMAGEPKSHDLKARKWDDRPRAESSETKTDSQGHTSQGNDAARR